MIRRIKKAFVDNMPNLKWMDSKTRVAAVSKVSIKVFHTVFLQILRVSLLQFGLQCSLMQSVVWDVSVYQGLLMGVEITHNLLQCWTGLFTSSLQLIVSVANALSTAVHYQLRLFYSFPVYLSVSFYVCVLFCVIACCFMGLAASIKTNEWINVIPRSHS